MKESYLLRRRFYIKMRTFAEDHPYVDKELLFIDVFMSFTYFIFSNFGKNESVKKYKKV